MAAEGTSKGRGRAGAAAGWPEPRGHGWGNTCPTRSGTAWTPNAPQAGPQQEKAKLVCGSGVLPPARAGVTLRWAPSREPGWSREPFPTPRQSPAPSQLPSWGESSHSARLRDAVRVYDTLHPGDPNGICLGCSVPPVATDVAREEDAQSSPSQILPSVTQPDASRDHPGSQSSAALRGSLGRGQL